MAVFGAIVFLQPARSVEMAKPEVIERRESRVSLELDDSTDRRLTARCYPGGSSSPLASERCYAGHNVVMRVSRPANYQHRWNWPGSR
jgi:hypothetical protein